MAKAPQNEPNQQRVVSKPPPSVAPCKLLEDMRNNPAGDWTIKQIETLCGQIGLMFKPPRRGSHFKAFSEHLDGMLTIPARKPIKSPYIKRLVALSDAHRHVMMTKRTGE
jgi:hypothetical protein